MQQANNQSDSVAPRCFVIVPAAGRSRRMSSPKLLLPWPSIELAALTDAPTVMDAVLDAWTSSRVSVVVVVSRADDTGLHEVCDRWPVVTLTPTPDPVDMKTSVQIGLRHIESEYQPTDRDFCFVAPADLPGLKSSVIARMMNEIDAASGVVLPRYGEQLGHPALLRWRITPEIFALGEDEGVDQVVKRHPQQFVAFAASERVSDIDTDAAYQHALAELRSAE